MKTNKVGFAKNISKLLVCLGLSVACFTAASSAYAAVAGHVQFVNGEVQLTDPAGQTRMAKKGDAISEGDTLTSAQKSSAQIKMQDGGYIAVRPDTRLKFDQFAFAGQEDGSEKSFFSLFKGGFRAVTGLIGRVNKQNYKITTPAATIGIRGTDHETVVIAPNGTAMPPGTYNMVNVGATSMTTNVGTVNVQPGAGMAYSPGMNQPPAIMPLNTSLFTASPPPAEPAPQPEGQGDQQGDSQQAGGQAEGGTQAAGGGEGSASGETAAEDTTIRETAVVDAAPPATGSAPAASTSTSAAAGTATEVIAPPTNTDTVLTTATAAGGTTVDITSGTVTTNTGQVIPVIDSVAAAQAQAAADAALAAANAAQAAATATATADSALAAVALVPTTPATTAIGTASAGIASADAAVTAATALTPADAALAAANAVSAQSTATSATGQAAAAQAAYTANGAFADSTAGPANTAVQSANSALQTANTAVQTAAGTVTAQNTALSTAQGAATTALTAANASLTTADNNLIAANTQNAAITTAQSAAPAQVTAAQTAAANAQTAATAAQSAATQAASLQAAGDLAGAQAQLLIAQQKLAFAQQQLALAQAAQTAVTSQLSAAQAAQTAASAAVTTSQQAAVLAADAAATASTQAAAAQTAAGSATAALAQTDPAVVSPAPSAANTVQTNSATIVANAPVAAYNNPAVAAPDRFIGVMSTVKADAGGGYVEGYGPGAGFDGSGTANTSFVLDSTGNLVEKRNAWYEETAASTATPQLVVPDANVKRTGGTAVETFKMPDNSIYAGRWVGGTLTITDNAAVVPAFTRDLGVTSEHWAIMLAPPTGYVQTLIGNVTYNKVGATSPTDVLGNAGTLNTASLTSNFTSQLVDATLNLTIAGKTLDVLAASMVIFGSSFSTDLQVTATCAGCGAATYYANVGGGFAGDGAASAGLNYTLWTGAAPGATTGAADLIQGMAAFSAATAPGIGTNPPTGNYDSFSHLATGTAGAWQRGRFNLGGLPAQPSTNFILDGAGNLVRSLHVNYNERPTWNLNGGPTNFADANIYYSGGVASDRYQLPDGSLTIGRWTGGTLTVSDNLGVNPTVVRNLGATSAYWGLRVAPAVGYVQALTGTTTYTQAGATLPPDTFGNVGTMPTASLVANFTNQTVDAGVAFSIANQSLTVSRASIPILAGSYAFDATLEAGTAPAVACTGAGCSGGGYLGWLTGNFAGAAAAGADVQYKVWPTATQGSVVSDIIQGIVAFSAATPPSVAGPVPYVATNTAVAYTGSYGGGFNFVAAPGDISPVGNPSVFTETYGDGAGFRTDTLNAPFTAITPTTVTTSGSTSITYGVWETVSSIGSTSQQRLDPGYGGSTLPMYMYGAQGYLDSPVVATSNTGPLIGLFSYNAVAMTSFQSDTWAMGNVTTATLSANFTSQTVSVALAGTMGPDAWTLNSANQPITFTNTANGAGARFSDNVPSITMNATACPTCVGHINGAFVGQNYAGAIVEYGIYDESPLLGMNAGGLVAFDRMPVGGNPAVTNSTPAPTGVTVVANSWQQIIESANAATTNGAGVLTGWGDPFWTATVTPATGSVANPAVGTGSGVINWGTWAAGSTSTNSFSYTPGTTQFHWITAPEPTPVYLAEVLTTTNAQYNLVGGDVTSLLGGVHGTVNGTTSLTVNFTAQTIAVNLALSVNGRNWAASTPNAPLQSLNNSNSMTGFFADSRRLPIEPGYLTVTVDGTAANGSLAGQLVGAALDGAILKFNLDGQVMAPTPGYEFVQGVAALEAVVANDPATPYRMVAVSLSDPMALVPTVQVGGSYNNAARVIMDGSGNLMQFDDNSGGGKGSTIQYVSGGLADQGSAVIAGATVNWGRWTANTQVMVTDRATGATQNVTLVSGAHAVIGPLMTGPVALPTTGVYGYTLVGNTTPTTDTGASGTFTSASLQANFTAQTVDLGVNVTAASATLNAVAANVPIQNRAMFYTDSRMTGPGALAVTCSGACGTTNHGAIGGGFGGPGGAGAAITYGFQKDGVNAGTVSGVAVFQQGAQIPQ